MSFNVVLKLSLYKTPDVGINICLLLYPYPLPSSSSSSSSSTLFGSRNRRRKMKIAIVAVVVMAMAAIVPEAFGATHTVGGSSGWTQGVDYTTWASGQNFTVGDFLLFTYGNTHSVQEVGQSDYTNCNTGNAIKSYSGGSNSIPLNTAGPLYYICPTPGHCLGGMKLMINVVASSTTPTTSPTPPTTSPSTPASNPPPPPPPSSGSVGLSGNSNALLIGASVLAAAVVGMMC